MQLMKSEAEGKLFNTSASREIPPSDLQPSWEQGLDTPFLYLHLLCICFFSSSAWGNMMPLTFLLPQVRS
jgi:hypothetical protein